MPFNTYTFIIFLAIVLGSYYTFRNWNARKIILLVASYAFYSAWNPVFILLLAFSTCVDWHLARLLHESKAQIKRKAVLGASLVANLGLLGYFKYHDFLLENAERFLSVLGVHYQAPELSIVLPVGISFYTFQTLSYTLDVYRNRLAPSKSFTDYALFVSFFPQLVAGPIVRAAEFLPQCESGKSFDSNRFGWGCVLLILGLFMKVVLADATFAPVVDTVYAQPDAYGTIQTWISLFSFSGQIFFDFSGYSTCAIGVALMLGFTLPDNFRFPYAAIGFRDFWRRWHISLSTWLRDYVYISIGGSRLGTLRTIASLLLTMLIGGLWHGASWMFVIWGGIHGLLLATEHIVAGRFKASISVSLLTRYFLALITFVFITIIWVFFRAESMQQVYSIFYNLSEFRQVTSSLSDKFVIAFAVIFTVFNIQFVMRNSNTESLFNNIPRWLATSLVFGMFASLFLFSSGDNRAFIYFQF